MNAFYREFVTSETVEGKQYNTARAYLNLLVNFESAVRAYGKTCEIFRTLRRNTTMKNVIPEEALTRFNAVLTLAEDTYAPRITPKFQKALEDARANAA